MIKFHTHAKKKKGKNCSFLYFNLYVSREETARQMILT